MRILGNFQRFFLCAAVATTALAVCSHADEVVAPGAKAPAKHLRIVATTFPAWDWIRQVLGDDNENVELHQLFGNGVDLHSSQPTVLDLKNVALSDLFVYIGGESDAWVDSALAAAPNPQRKALSLLDALGDAAKDEQFVEGMERDSDEADSDGAQDRDEHVWLSLRNAKTLVDALADALATLDQQRAEVWRANAAAYCETLDALDQDYAATIAGASRKTLVVADRFPLRYLADDYGLSYFAAFAGCSAESEASFKTIVFLAAKADALGANSLLVLEGGDNRVATAVRAAMRREKASIVVFDSLQSTTSSEVNSGKTYLGAMRKNLASLAEALK